MLKEVVFQGESSLERIGKYAFSFCALLESFDFPDSLRIIEAHCFLESGLKEFVAPSAIAEIGDEAFRGSQALRFIRLNDGLKRIGNRCFSESGVQDVVIS